MLRNGAGLHRNERPESARNRGRIGPENAFRDIKPEFGGSLMNAKTLSASPKAEIRFIEPNRWSES